MSNVIANIPNLSPPKHTFDLSYTKLLTCDMGRIIPILMDEAIPGDTWEIGNDILVRLQPLAAPLMHDITVDVHYFFVPYRILWPEWSKFIRNESSETLPEFPILEKQLRDKYSLWDYFGLPVIDMNLDATALGRTVQPMAFPWMAYHLIWNEYFRDKDLQQETDITTATQPSPNNNQCSAIKWRCWAKDYFTMARPWRTKQQAPALPINVEFGNYSGAEWLSTFLYGKTTGVTAPFEIRSLTAQGNVDLNVANLTRLLGGSGSSGSQQPLTREMAVPISNSDFGTTLPTNNTFNQAIVATGSSNGWRTEGGETIAVPMNQLANLLKNNMNIVSSSFNIADLRVVAATTLWLERNARQANDETTFLRAHFGVAPTDERLQRPEYIGGTKDPLIISEVLQTSETQTSPQGNMAGHGISTTFNDIDPYRVQEFGVVVGLLSIMPKPVYASSLNRQWTRKTFADFYMPEFANLSEQGIMNYEVSYSLGYLDRDKQLFGYTGAYDECRVKNNIVTSDMRKTYRVENNSIIYEQNLSYWNLAREWTVFGDPIALNSGFVECRPRKDVFLEQSTPGCIVEARNILMVSRPMPQFSIPGRLDHTYGGQ